MALTRFRVLSEDMFGAKRRSVHTEPGPQSSVDAQTPGWKRDSPWMRIGRTTNGSIDSRFQHWHWWNRIRGAMPQADM